MNPDRNKLLEKIQALLAMADVGRGATEAEAASFFRKAQELMTRHGIEQMELENLTGDAPAGFDIGEEFHDTGRSRRNADNFIFRIIKAAFGVQMIFYSYYVLGSRTPKLRYLIIGETVDRAMAKMVIPELSAQMRKGFNQWKTETGKGHTEDLECSYCHGVCDGYLNASEEGKALALKHASKEVQEQWGLMLVGKADAVEKFTADNHKNLKTISVSDGKSRDAYGAGHAKGSTMSLTPKQQLRN